MNGTAQLARSSLRHTRWALVAVALVIALGFGAALASFGAAWQTENAYPEYLRDADVSEVVVNLSLPTDRMAEVIAATPGIERMTSDSLFLATADDGAPRRRGLVDSTRMQVRSSDDGRYVDADRPVVHEGRMVQSGAEAFVSVETAEALGLEVGDDLPLAFWPSTYSSLEPPDPATPTEPLGRVNVRVVGIGVFADEVLPEGLYPRRRVLVPDDVTAPFDCIPSLRGDGDGASAREISDTLAPSDCALAFRYFSLHLRDGERGLGPVLAHLTERLEIETAQLPAALGESGLLYQLIPAIARDERVRVERSLDPAVNALRIFALIAGSATFVLCGFIVTRVARRARADGEIWSQLGATRGQRADAIAVGPLLATVVGGLVALGAGRLAADLGPVASAEALAPSGLETVPIGELLAVVGIVGGLALIGITVVALLESRLRVGHRARRSRQPLADAAMRSGYLPFAFGFRAATGSGGGARPLIGAAIAALTVLVATVIFSANLSQIIAEPARHGWPYDLGVVVGFGYGGADPDAAATALDRDDVKRWGIATTATAVVNGAAIPMVAGMRDFDAFPPTMVSGRPPRRPNEVAVGSRTAADLGIGIGDRVRVRTDFATVRAEVTGLAVMPPVGPYLADRSSLGTGVLLADGTLEPSLAADFGSFIVVDLADGVDAASFADRLEREIATFDRYGFDPFVHPSAVRPAQIADVAALRSTPVLLAVLVAAAMTIGLALAVALGARARRHELAVLRTLGATGAQLRASIRWQSLTVVGIGIVVGIALGIVLGRFTWRGFAESLGIAEQTLVPVAAIAILVVAAIVVGLLAAFEPGRRAARISPAAVLREDGG